MFQPLEVRLRFAMRRLRALVVRATVHLSDVNGPRGGADKRCQIELKTDKQGLLVVSSTGDDWRSVVDKALHRAVQSLTRSVQRSKTRARLRHELLPAL